jgi:uncharacterized coiled-coil DUF342 family protein
MTLTDELRQLKKENRELREKCEKVIVIANKYRERRDYWRERCLELTAEMGRVADETKADLPDFMKEFFGGKL